ncbi:MAG: hypothetical protein LV471_11230 [Nitrosomonas sp.]|nr:hypothetical protein [Nitrosomonas sp.]
MSKARREQKMLVQHMADMQGSIFCEQRRIVMKRGKQAIRKTDARKCGFLEIPLNQPGLAEYKQYI